MRLRTWSNAHTKKRTRLILIAMNVATPILTFGGTFAVLRIWERETTGSADHAMAWGLFATVLIPILRSHSRVLSALFQAPELRLLMTAPLRPAMVFFNQFWALLWGRRGSFFMTMGYVSAYGVATGAPFEFYVAQVAAIGSLFLLTYGLLGSTLLAVVKSVPANKLRTGMLLLGTFTSLAVSISIQILLISLGRYGFAQVRRPPSGDVSSFVLSSWLPSAWAFRALTLLGSGQRALGLLWLLTLMTTAGALMAVSFLLFSRHHEAIYVRLQEQDNSRRGGRKSGGLLRRMLKGFPAPMRALIIKDWKIQVRDVNRVLSLAGQMTFYSVWGLALLSGRATGGERSLGRVSPVIAAILIMASLNATSTLSQDRMHLPLIRASPLGMRRFLLSKGLLSLPLVLITAGVPIVVVMKRAVPASPVPVLIVLTSLCIWGSVMVTLGTAATGKTNEAGDPSFQGRTGPRAIGMALRLAMLASAGLLLTAYWGAADARIETAVLPWLDTRAILIAGFVASFAGTLALLTYGAHRLEKTAEED